MEPPTLDQVVGILLLAGGSALAAAILRWARVPGAWALGGVLAGVLAGPAVLGRLAPAAWERYVGFAPAERAAFHLAQRELQGLEFVVANADGAPIRADDPRAAARARVAECGTALSAALWREEAWMRAAVVAAAVVTLLGLGLQSARTFVPGSPAEGAATGGATAALPVSPQALIIGAWAAAVPGLGALLVLAWSGAPAFGPATLAAAAALAVGPGRLAASDRAASERVEPGGAALVARAGHAASLAALLLLAAAVVRDGGAAWWVWLMVAGALLLGWRTPARAARVLRGAAAWVAAPALVAFAASRVEIFLEIRLLPLLALVLLAGDGRWLGAFVGSALQKERRSLRSARLVLPMMAAAPMQAAITAVAAFYMLMDPWMVAALVAGVAVVEATAPMRRGAADRLAELERELPEPQ